MGYNFILPSFFRGVQCESRPRALQRWSRRSEAAVQGGSGNSTDSKPSSSRRI